jgi:hypothetical protein
MKTTYFVIGFLIVNMLAMHIIAWLRLTKQSKNWKQELFTASGFDFLKRYLPKPFRIWFVLSSLAAVAAAIVLYTR